MKTAAILIIPLLTALSAVAETGAERANRLLEAMGGRDAWAKVKFVHVEAIHDQLNLKEPYRNRIWNDFSGFRVRFEAKNDEIDRRRGYAGDKGWYYRDGEMRPVDAATIDDERRWWEANIYRTLHRLAVGDPELTARAVGDDRLEIFRADGVRLNWFLLNPAGAPMLFATWDSEVGTVFGRLASNGSINYPKSGGRPDGSWRYEIVRLETAETAPAEIDFNSP